MTAQLKALRALAYLWAAPWTLFGLLLVIPLKLTGSALRFRRGVWTCYGPSTQTLLRRAPISGGAAALTLGHVILACDEMTLHRTFDHEMIHVGQYERWGVFFIPVYFLASLWLLIRRRDYYRENPFEIPAFALDAQRQKEKHPKI